MRDLKAYSLGLGGRLSYYRDRYGLECDAVLHLKDGRYALIEIKLGSFEIEEGAKHLLEVKGLIRKYNETEKQCPLAEPDILMVVTGGEFAYTRDDGVHIVPISCLKPKDIKILFQLFIINEKLHISLFIHDVDSVYEILEDISFEKLILL